jgi:hypothetical protein
MDGKCFYGPRDSMNDAEVKEILGSTENIAVVGASEDPSRASHDILRFLIGKGFNVFPVNPNHNKVMGKRCVPTLRDIDEEIELVNIFRNPIYVEPIIRDAIQIGARCVWLQMGVVNKNAYDISLNAGLKAIMNRCIMVEYKRLIGQD